MLKSYVMKQKLPLQYSIHHLNLIRQFFLNIYYLFIIGNLFFASLMSPTIDMACFVTITNCWQWLLK